MPPGVGVNRGAHCHREDGDEHNRGQQSVQRENTDDMGYPVRWPNPKPPTVSVVCVLTRTVGSAIGATTASPESKGTTPCARMHARKTNPATTMGAISMRMRDAFERIVTPLPSYP